MERRSTANGPRLLDQVRELIRIRHYSIRTEQAYVQWIRRFILFHGKRHPRDMGGEELSENITFRYQHSKTQTWQQRTLPGEDFIALLLQHVLPTGLRRVRDYGFLHANPKALLRLLQFVLRVVVPSRAARPKAHFLCTHCHGQMLVIAMRTSIPRSG